MSASPFSPSTVALPALWPRLPPLPALSLHHHPHSSLPSSALLPLPSSPPDLRAINLSPASARSLKISASIIRPLLSTHMHFCLSLRVLSPSQLYAAACLPSPHSLSRASSALTSSLISPPTSSFLISRPTCRQFQPHARPFPENFSKHPSPTSLHSSALLASLRVPSPPRLYAPACLPSLHSLSLPSFAVISPSSALLSLLRPTSFPILFQPSFAIISSLISPSLSFPPALRTLPLCSHSLLTIIRTHLFPHQLFAFFLPHLPTYAPSISAHVPSFPQNFCKNHSLSSLPS